MAKRTKKVDCSSMVRSMLKCTKDPAKTKIDISTHWGTSRDYFNNKLSRNSFSIDDLLDIATICNTKIVINPAGDGLRIDVQSSDYLKNKIAAKKEYENMRRAMKYLENLWGFKEEADAGD